MYDSPYIVAGRVRPDVIGRPSRSLGCEIHVRDSDYTDDELVQAVAAGDTEAFREFFRRHAPSIVALCQKILHSRQDAEDVASEVFFELWSKLEKYNRHRGTPRTYLILLARSRAIDRLRSRSNRPDYRAKPPGDHPIQATDLDPYRSLDAA